MSEFNRIKGQWKHAPPWDSDDYLTLYVISGTEYEPVVTGKDLNDGEAFEISDVVWLDNKLCFTSLMPSIQRKGINKFKVNDQGDITAQYSFTVVE